MKNFIKHAVIATAMTVSGFANATTIPSLDIDFRDSSWSAASGLSTYTSGNVTISAVNIGESNTSVFYQDSTDGLGVRAAGGTSNCSYETDEIDSCEKLRVYLTDLVISEVWITDLFTLPTEPTEYGRLRFMTADDSTWQVINFNGTNSDNANGEQRIDLGGDFEITEIQFFVPVAYRDGSEFSVAGFTVVPEPMPLILMGLSIIGFGALRRKKQ